MGWFDFLISSNFMYAFRDTSTFTFTLHSHTHTLIFTFTYSFTFTFCIYIYIYIYKLTEHIVVLLNAIFRWVIYCKLDFQCALLKLHKNEKANYWFKYCIEHMHFTETKRIQRINPLVIPSICVFVLLRNLARSHRPGFPLQPPWCETPQHPPQSSSNCLYSTKGFLFQFDINWDFMDVLNCSRVTWKIWDEFYISARYVSKISDEFVQTVLWPLTNFLPVGFLCTLVHCQPQNIKS